MFSARFQPALSWLKIGRCKNGFRTLVKSKKILCLK